MSRFSVEDHIIFCRCERAIASRNYHCRIVLFLIRHMRADQVIHTVKMSVINDGFRAADTLFRRLEDQFHGSMELILNRHQDFRHTKTNGGMSIMSAGMHEAFIYRVKSLFRRSVARIMLLEYAEGIDIKPHGNRRTFAAAQDSDHTGHSSLCVLNKLRIRSLGNGTLILFL